VGGNGELGAVKEGNPIGGENEQHEKSVGKVGKETGSRGKVR